jgi:molybdenum cofactor synthesis domain-containing protein
MKMETRKVKLEDAVGMILCHDITEIIPGERKGRAFKKGHRIEAADLDRLRGLGKNHIYVLHMDEDEVHEDDAARILGEILGGQNVEVTEPYESRVNLHATVHGLLKVDTEGLYALNCLEDVVASTLPNYSIVTKGEMVAGTKVTPLVVKREIMETAQGVRREKGTIVSVIPFQPVKVSIVITGTEVYKGIIKDAFQEVLTKKVEALGGTVIHVSFAPDDEGIIREKIQEAVSKGSDVVLVSGGMSVDPDDVTPKAIRSVADVVKYGSPVLPGAMFMMSYIGDIAVIGIPACGMYAKITVFDLIYPRVAAGIKITKADIIALANGGLCRKCDPCRFPNCSFGRG